MNQLRFEVFSNCKLFYKKKWPPEKCIGLGPTVQHKNDNFLTLQSKYNPGNQGSMYHQWL